MIPDKPINLNMNRIDQRLQKSEMEFIRNCENLEKAGCLKTSVTNNHTPMEIGEMENEDSSTIITTLSFRVFLLLVIIFSSLSISNISAEQSKTLSYNHVRFSHTVHVSIYNVS